MGLIKRAKQAVEMALEVDEPSQSPASVEPLPGGWTDEQLAEAAASTPDSKGLVPGRAIVQETDGVAEQEGKVLFSRTSTQTILRLRKPGGELGARVEKRLWMSHANLTQVKRGLEVPVLVRAGTDEIAKIDAQALAREL